MSDICDQPVLQECATCGALIDVTDEEPFALMHCPTCGGAMRVRRQFGVFELQDILGAGGMGAVYRALDTNLNRSVALKLLRKEFSANPEFIRGFEREAAITAGINHPNVVKVYSTGIDHSLYFIAMELVDKGSLDDLMTLQGRVAEAQVLEVGIQIAQGLNAALQRGLIHRDIKPGNILFADAHHSKIVDFGLAVLMDQAGEVGGEIWGTPYYVAPEKLDQQPEDFRSDMYSLGATLFHAVAGRPPYEAEDASMVALKHLKSQPVSLQAFAPDVSSAAAYVINKTLNKDPDERYASYEERIEHLEYARGELLAKAATGRPKARVVLEDEQSQRMMSWVTLGMLATLAVGGIAFFGFRDRLFGTPKPAPVVAAAQARNPKLSIEADAYKEARSLLIGGKSAEAAAAFRKLAAEKEVPQPLHNWLILHAGLAAILDGEAGAAKSEWERLGKGAQFSYEPAEQKLADFFKVIAVSAADGKPQRLEEHAFATTSFEALGLLVLGAENFALGSYEESRPFFRQFQSAKPEPPFAWVADYKEIAGRFSDELARYSLIQDQLKAANGAKKVDEQKGALVKLKEAAEKLELPGALKEKAGAAVAEFETQLAARESGEAQDRAEREAADALSLAEVKTKANALSLQYKFAEAKALLAPLQTRSSKGKRSKDALVKKTEWLGQFKATLIQDINGGGYAAPVAKKSGAPLPGGVQRASEAGVESRTPYGTVPAAWIDLAPDSVLAMARSFFRPGTPPDRLADRKWLLAAYCYFVGKAPEGRALATEAAQEKPTYLEQIAIFTDPNSGQ